MAYMANGAEGDYYEAKYCQRCVHFESDDGLCPVLQLHLLWNYDAANGDNPNATPEKKAKHTALDMLWPREGVYNGQCAMFHEMPNKELSTNNALPGAGEKVEL